MTKRLYFCLTLCCTLLPLWATDVVHTSMTGVDSASAEYFRKWYHRSDLIYYLEALNDHAIVETHVSGQWSLPERVTFAVEGLPFVQNRYYIDGFRVDDRFQPGSTQYLPSMQQYNLYTNTHSSQLYFEHDSLATDYVEATYNFGRITNGEPMPGTAAIVNITHRTAQQSAETWKHVNARRHLRGAGVVDGAFTLHDREGNAYRQHLYAHYGERRLTRENERALIEDNPYYNAYFYKVQADGLLPMRPNRHFTSLGYRLNFAGRSDAGSEYLMNYNEVYDLKNYTGSVYAKRTGLTTGLTWATNVTHHSDREFRRNIIDQDGESFEPWVPDGTTHELSWAVNYEQPLYTGLTLKLDAYNSFFYFRPEQQQWSNTVYMQTPITPEQSSAAVDLYRYEWNSRAFASGLLENTLALHADYTLCRPLDLHAFVGVSLDGMLLRGKSKVSPNVVAGIQLDLHPCRWFEMGLSLEHNRLTYTADYLRYFSSDYLNGVVYYAGTDQVYSTVGGQYHNYARNLQQTAYVNLDIPIRFHFRDKHDGLHEIVLQQSYKRFYHAWLTRYQDGIDANGYYMEQSVSADRTMPVYYTNPGEKQYEIGYADNFGTGFIRNSPYYFSQLTRYTYTGRKVIFSLSWQSMQSSGYCGLGNGAMMNNVGQLSESTANPNTRRAVQNPNGAYAGVGRYDLDKGYVARIYLGYNICRWVQAGLTAKWTDGKPFVDYQYFQNAGQVAIMPFSSRGTNPTDNHFGTRHGAVYNIDLHLQGTWQVRGCDMRINLECYNLWDFCHDLCEMSFVQDIPQAKRASMIMNVPTGLKLTYSVQFNH